MTVSALVSLRKERLKEVIRDRNEGARANGVLMDGGFGSSSCVVSAVEEEAGNGMVWAYSGSDLKEG